MDLYLNVIFVSKYYSIFYKFIFNNIIVVFVLFLFCMRLNKCIIVLL